MLNKLREHFDKSKNKAAINPRKTAAIVLLLVLVVGGIIWGLNAFFASGMFTVSGTIEATEIHLGSEYGGRVENVYVKEGEKIAIDQLVADVRRTSGTRERLRSPIDGVVLERLFEPGEITTMGSAIVSVANLEQLTLTVYVPEDRYGQISLGQTYAVTVDSFPDQIFYGTVSYISDKAEFTPRNVQTTDSRRTTVFAIRLDMPPSEGKLKPGMPADVKFQTSR